MTGVQTCALPISAEAVSAAIVALRDRVPYRELETRARALLAELTELAHEVRDLGERMHRAMERALRRYRRCLLIGTDCPVLTPQHLRDASAALAARNDAVLIPAEDGGYALIGLARCDARLFENIAWGGDTVLADTRERLRQLKWRWHELETLWDIDRPDDYRRWSELIILNENKYLA